MLTRIIVRSAYFLKNAKRYQSTKRFFYDLLENTNSQIKRRFDVFMITLVLLSVAQLIYEVDHNPDALGFWFDQAVVGIFILEYLLRGWIYSDGHKIILEHYERAEYLNSPFQPGHALWQAFTEKAHYLITPMAIIDLLAILPSYRPLRVLRVLLVFRLFKLFRYFSSIKLFANILASKRFELSTLSVFLGFIIFIGTVDFYLFENIHDGGQVSSLFDALYWAIVTVATVGYGDITPITFGGRIVAMALILSGVGVLSFFISIIVTAFNEEIQELQENTVYAELNRYKRFVIICGFGRVGQHIARQLRKDRQHFVVLDINEDHVLKAKQLGYLVIHADASKNDVLKNARINNGASAVLCVTGDDVTNVYIALTSRHLNKDIQIISRANGQENVKKMYQAGANNVIQPFEMAGMLVAEYIGQPTAFEAILGILHEESHILMEALPVHTGSFIDGKTINEIDFKVRKLLLLGIISAHPPISKEHKASYPLKNQHFYFNPEQYFQLRDGDLLVVLGRPHSITHFRNELEKSRTHQRSKQ